jgi:hypothetical protein
MFVVLYRLCIVGDQSCVPVANIYVTCCYNFAFNDQYILRLKYCKSGHCWYHGTLSLNSVDPVATNRSYLAIGSTSSIYRPFALKSWARDS